MFLIYIEKSRIFYPSQIFAEWLQENKNKEAIIDFNNAIKLNPRLADAYRERGFLSDEGNAIRYFLGMAVKLNPKDTEAKDTLNELKEKHNKEDIIRTFIDTPFRHDYQIHTMRSGPEAPNMPTIDPIRRRELKDAVTQGDLGAAIMLDMADTMEGFLPSHKWRDRASDTIKNQPRP